MKPIEETLRERFKLAIGLAFGAEYITDPLIKNGDPKHADFQSNVAMPLAKKMQPALPPRQVAERIVQRLDLTDLCETPTIAGPGFINLRLKKDFLASRLKELAAEPREGFRAGVERISEPQTVVVDYSGPNVAKQMHVGHLRSTIIGDTIARCLDLLGHNTIRQNHIGDFGTQFGMLIEHIQTMYPNVRPEDYRIENLDQWYKEATTRFKSDEGFRTQARLRLVELQEGNATCRYLWNNMRAVTREHYHQIYDMLNVTLTDAHVRGESFYEHRLPKLLERVRATFEFGGEGASAVAHSGARAKPWEVGASNVPATEALEAKNALESADAVKRIQDAAKPDAVRKPFASLSDGALCIFLPGYVNEDGSPLPLMVQKSDGGFPYSATDLAALYFRVRESKATPEDQKPLDRDWHADRVIYLTDARQSQHFAMVFDAFRAAHWDALAQGTDATKQQHDDATKSEGEGTQTWGKTASLEHAPFGSILGEDRKPYKTREGKAVALMGFIEDAIDAARKEVQSKNPDLAAEKQERIARAVGLAAIKYADLRNDRTTDYVFNADQMVAFEGNTGPYLQYAFTRVRSIFRKAGMTPEQLGDATLLLDAPAELSLAKLLVRFPTVIESVARDLKPHYLCTYLYELAQAYSGFYENCPVLQAPGEDIKRSRLLLCDLVARTLDLGLTQLLGIPTLEEM